jgi:hypothetical protein
MKGAAYVKVLFELRSVLKVGGMQLYAFLYILFMHLFIYLFISFIHYLFVSLFIYLLFFLILYY